MQRQRKWACKGCYTLVWSENMMHGSFRTEGKNATQFSNCNGICRENNFTKTLIHLFFYCTSQTTAARSTIDAVIWGLISKYHAGASSRDIFIFDSVLRLNKSNTWTKQKAPPSRSTSATLQRFAYHGPEKPSEKTLCVLLNSEYSLWYDQYARNRHQARY